MKQRKGYGTIFPYMMCANAVELIEFLKSTFAAEEFDRVVSETGEVANCQIRIGDTMFMLSGGSAAFPPMPGSYYIYVESADRTMQMALENGASLVLEVADRPYGDRQGGITDPGGNIWWISERIFDEN